MKIRTECATAQKVAVPLNKNGWWISRNDFVTVRGTVFKSQSVRAGRPVVNKTWGVAVRSRRQLLNRFTQAVYLDCNFAKRLLKYAITDYAFAFEKAA